MKRWFKIGVALCLSVVILAGCGLGSNKDVKVSGNSTLKVMAYSEDFFYQEYGLLFSALYPHIEIEIVSSNLLYDLMEENDQNYGKALKMLMEKEQPDVVLVDDPSVISTFIEEGAFLSLDSIINDEKYNAQGLIPGVIDNMKEIGSGTVYTIPTSFSTQVLFYNKDLFDQFNIPYPTDQMTWEQIVNLAKQFPVEEDASTRLFGLKMGWGNQLNDIINELSTAQGITYFNAEELKMTMDTPAWAALVEQAIDISQSNILFSETMYSDANTYVPLEGAESADPFLSGRLAMKLDSTYYFSQIEQAQMYATDPNSLVQNWDIVTAPVSSQRPDSTTYTSLYNFIAINSASKNVDAAKTYISYITGDEFARVKSNLSYGDTPLRTEYIKEDNIRNYEAVYKLKPLNNNLVSYYKVPQRFLIEFDGHLQQALMDITEGQLTIEQALAELELKGNELLATKLMTQEEYEQYWIDNNVSGVIVP